MLKRADSAYVAGRPKGLWFKWKRDAADGRRRADVRPARPRQALVVLFRLHVRLLARGGEGDELVPVGKAYFGFTDEELAQLDNWVRNHTTERFGPVREVEQELVLRGRVRQRAALDPAQVRRGAALPAHQPHPLGQAGRTRPTASRRWRPGSKNNGPGSGLLPGPRRSDVYDFFSGAFLTILHSSLALFSTLVQSSFATGFA